MKISKSTKKTVKASTDSSEKYEDHASTTIESSSYTKAEKYIKAAIDVLAQSAKTDEVARDSIANLGVVMLDLRGSKDKQ